MIDRFLDNSEVPVCGANVLVLVKRFPNEKDVSRLIAKVRQHHVLLTFWVTFWPSGGTQPQSLYTFATRVNGMCAVCFSVDSDYFYEPHSLLTYLHPWLIYAANPTVSGQGSIVLPQMTSSVKDAYFVTGYLDGTDISVEYDPNPFLLKWKDIASGSITQLGIAGNGTSDGGYGPFFANYEQINTTVYEMSLEFNYTDTKWRTLPIRVFTRTAVNDWVPYDD